MLKQACLGYNLLSLKLIKGVEKKTQPGGFVPIGVPKKTIFQKWKKQGAQTRGRTELLLEGKQIGCFFPSTLYYYGISGRSKKQGENTKEKYIIHY